MGTWTTTALLILNLGGDKRDRTADLLHAMQALSQLSYTPLNLAIKLQDTQNNPRFYPILLRMRKLPTGLPLIGVSELHLYPAPPRQNRSLASVWWQIKHSAQA